MSSVRQQRSKLDIHRFIVESGPPFPPSRPLGCLSPSARMIDRRGCYRHAYVALSSKIERVNGAKAFQRS